MQRSCQRASSVTGSPTVPGDKSLSHRALIVAALCEGDSRIENLAPGGDVAATSACLAALGVGLEAGGTGAIVHGRGLHGLTAPAGTLDCKNRPTTMRLPAGPRAGARKAAPPRG